MQFVFLLLELVLPFGIGIMAVLLGWRIVCRAKSAHNGLRSLLFALITTFFLSPVLVACGDRRFVNIITPFFAFIGALMDYGYSWYKYKTTVLVTQLIVFCVTFFFSYRVLNRNYRCSHNKVPEDTAHKFADPQH